MPRTFAMHSPTVLTGIFDSVDRLVAAAPQIPIIVLCSTQDELVAKKAIQRGAQIYPPKEHLNNYLLPKHRHAM